MIPLYSVRPSLHSLPSFTSLYSKWNLNGPSNFNVSLLNLLRPLFTINKPLLYSFSNWTTTSSSTITRTSSTSSTSTTISTPNHTTTTTNNNNDQHTLSSTSLTDSTLSIKTKLNHHNKASSTSTSTTHTTTISDPTTITSSVPSYFFHLHPLITTPVRPPTLTQLYQGLHFFRTPIRPMNSPSIFSKNLNFKQGGPSLGGYPEIAFLGPSNAGKSNLLNLLFQRSQSPLAKSTKKPGTTKKIHFYSVNNKCILVDTMGYGKNSQREWGAMLEDYLCRRKELCKIYWLLPSSTPELHPNDFAILSLLLSIELPFSIIITKIDLVNHQQLLQKLHQLQTRLFDPSLGYGQDILCTSTKLFQPLWHPSDWCPDYVLPHVSSTPPPPSSLKPQLKYSLNRVSLLPDQLTVVPMKPSLSSTSVLPWKWQARWPGITQLQYHIYSDVMKYREAQKLKRQPLEMKHPRL